MCGIAGIVSTTGVDADTVHRMCDVLVHRGPDDDGFHHSEHAVLGVRRLAIIDVVGGHQPVYSEDRDVVAVLNGEIYNFVELRRALSRRGHRFATGGDSECLVHLYEEYGADLVHELRGMFAFALWDRRRRRLLLGRDRVGKKPLYWRADGNSLSFGSELKALLRDPAASREVDEVALHHYLTYQYVPAPWSICRGIRKLPPGHLLDWHDGTVRVRRYWRLDFAPRTRGTGVPGRRGDGGDGRTWAGEHHSVEDAAATLRELLLDATRIRMVSERPIGAFLSGGLDSSAVVAAMARQASGRIKTFSIGFDDRRHDERRYARLVAQRYGTDHHEMVVTASALTALPTLTWHFDEPFADSSAIPSFYVAKLARHEATVVLNGDGGDECFGGYGRYVAMTRPWIPVPRVVRPWAERVGRHLTAWPALPSPVRRVGRFMEVAGHPPARRYARLISYFTPREKHELYTPQLRARLAEADSLALVADAFAGSNADCDAGRAIEADVATYLHGDLLVKMDLATMANSIEARSPFLDQHLMEWAAGLPTRFKIRSGVTKWILKESMAAWLPTELIVRPKQGFTVPIGSWLRTELRALSWDVLTDATARSRGYFRPETVTRLLTEHGLGRDHGRKIWALVQFELWHRMFVDGRGGPGAGPSAAACGDAAGSSGSAQGPSAPAAGPA